MKISLLKDNLEKGLSVVEKIAAKSANLPILGNVLLSAEKNSLLLSATDLEMGLRYWILSKTDEEGKISIPARLFSDLIRSVNSSKLELETKGSVLLVRGHQIETSINGQSAEDFPIIPTINKEKTTEVNCLNFCHGLSQVIDLVSVSQSRPEIGGVYFKISLGQITMAATDSFRLGEKQVVFSKEKNKSSQEEEYALIVPPKIAREAVNVFSEKEGSMRISFSRNQISFEYQSSSSSAQKIEMISRLIEGEFPNYQEIIPEKYDSQARASKEELLSHVKAASLFSPKTSEISIKIIPEKGEIELLGHSQDSGEYKSFLKADCQGKALGVNFSWKFIAGGLANIKSKEIILGLQENEKPAIIRPVGDASYLYVVMPMHSAP